MEFQVDRQPHKLSPSRRRLVASRQPAPVFVRWCCLAVVMVLLGALAAAAQELGDLGGGAAAGDDPFASALSDLEQDLGSGWWDENWKLRQLLIIDDPGIAVAGGKPVFLTDPEPLLLYNTGRARLGLTDVRIVDMRGDVLESGVVRFGNDDGTSMIWMIPPAGKIQMPYRVYVYYGNPDAPDAGHKRLVERADAKREINVHLGPEEALGGVDLPADETFFDTIRSVEFESFVDAQGRKPGGVHSRDRADFIAYSRAGASGEWVAAPSVASRSYESADWPISGYGEVELPEAGAWYVHVRYRAGVFRHDKLVRKLEPFKVQIGEHEVTAGVHQEGQAFWEWDSFELELPEGRIPLKVTWLGRCSPDSILFTKDKDYIPDYRDVSGPVWMRFKLVGDSDQRFYGQMYCVNVPWSSSGPQGMYKRFYLREMAVPILDDVKRLAADRENLMRYNKWSTWGESMSSSGITWWTQMSFHTAPGLVRQTAIADADVEFEFATRPTAGRRFRSGKGKLNDGKMLFIRMPENPGLDHVLGQTRSFDQWAQHRIDQLEKMQLPPSKHPKKIFFATMAKGYTDVQRELIFKHISAVGFSGMDMPMDVDEYVRLAEKYDLDGGNVAHHWRPDIELSLMPDQPPVGQSYTQWVENYTREVAARQYTPEGRWHKGAHLTRLLIMGDEIGPSTVWFYINASPMLLCYFREWLATQGCTPGDFGKSDWSDVYALGYETPSTKSQARLREIDDSYESDDEREVRQRDSDLLEAALSQGAAWAENAGGENSDAEPAATPTGDTGETAEGEAIEPDTMTAAISTLDEMGTESDMAAEEAAADARYALAVPADATPQEKQLYHWTQKFRSHYTAMLHRFGSDSIAQSHEDGHFKYKPLASPNFQAMPAQKGRMWTGALNLFDLGRTNGLHFMQLEDWTWNPYKMAFGMEILNAACRKNGQPVGALIVGGGVELRALACLGLGSRSIMSYLYGPRRVIGPPWAEHELTQRQWHRLSRWVANLEDDMLATHRRPAEAAILVANTTETNSAYIYTPLWERQYIYMSLMNSGVPVEAVGEEEIIEDDALSRYKVLYVADLHVDSKAQQKIKKWVENGGVLWGAMHALARQEYDEPTDRFDEVFGLAKRDPITEAPTRALPVEQRRTVTVRPGDYLQAAALQPGYPPAVLHPSPGAEVLATYEDGSAAMVRNRYGKGTAFLLGISSVTGEFAADQRAGEQPGDAAIRRVADIAAHHAGVQPHAVVHRPRVIHYVNDGPAQTMVFLLNCSGAKAKAVEVDVMTDRPVKHVVNGDLEEVGHQPIEGGIRVTVDIEDEGGLILAIRH